MVPYANRMNAAETENRKLRSLTDSLTAADMVSFAAGAPAQEAYPLDTLREISQEIFHPGPVGCEAMKYGSTLGFSSLRESVRDQLLAPRGLHTDLENIMITTGGIQPMNFMCQLFINPGDVILIESPSFVHVSMIFKLFEAKLVPCQMDADGLDMADVEAKIKEHHPKIIYTMPTFHNPTGVTLSLERRKKLAELASQYDVMVLEDDPYREIRYSGEHLPPIKAFDKTGHVVFANSFSKIFSPGSRLGYIAASKEIIGKLDTIKLATDTCTGTISQALCAEFFKKGYYPQHLEHLCNLYRSRRDAMLESLDAFFPEGTTHTLPDGGYYIWTELPEPLDATALSGQVAGCLNICYGLGSSFYSEGNPPGMGNRCMRLNFSGLNEATIRINIKKLGDFFKSKQSSPDSLSV